MKKQDNTYYDLLKVDRASNIAEIVAAYHCAKNAFSRDSLATYSLFSAEEIQIELGRLEEAYLTLSNSDKKRDYDRLLALKGPQTGSADETPQPQQAAEFAVEDRNQKTEEAILPHAEPITATTDITGRFLRDVRTRRGLSLDDVSRITKIPTKFLKSIEDEDIARLPARVYVQGFIKNIATLYKLDPPSTAVAYLSSIYTPTKQILKN